MNKPWTYTHMKHSQGFCTLALAIMAIAGIFCFGDCQGSLNKNDVMYNPSRYWTLSNGDKATIGFIYQGEAYYKPQGSHGNFEIYVMKPNGSLQTRLTNNPAYDADPDWALVMIK